MSEAALLSFIAALFSIMNPLGNVGIFAGLTENFKPEESRVAAIVCAVSTAITLLLMLWLGNSFLDFFGLTVDTLRAAGGIIVLLIGLNMLSNNNSHRHTPSETEEAPQSTTVGIVPLAIPIVAGPGTMVTVLVAGQQNPNLLSKTEISVVIVFMSLLIGVFFSFATRLSKFMGKTGMGVVTRVMGMILTAISMGLLADGLKGLLPGLAT